MKTAITRKVSGAILRCELTHLARQPIDFVRAQKQHATYEECLAAAGCKVESLPAEPELPDAVFVEDAAVAFDEIALIARPGAESRRAEVESVARALAQHRKPARIEPPGTLDGGDVLRIGKRVLVGLSQRTNAAGIGQMRAALAPFGYSVESVPVKGCLHLKSAATQVAENTVLLNPRWIDRALFPGMDCIEVAPEEPLAANALWLCSGQGGVIFPAEYPATRARLEACGIRIVPVEVSEFAKAEGGVTCCSIILR